MPKELATSFAKKKTMGFGKKKEPVVEEAPPVDDTAWMLDNPISDFILMHSIEIKFMCMVAYCLGMHASNRAISLADDDAATVMYEKKLIK